MEVRLNLTVEVDQVANALAIKTPVPIQLVYEKNQWRAQCESPSLRTDTFDTLEQAIIAGARDVAAEVQAAVDDRPLIIGQITPDSVPQEMFD